MSHRVRRVHLYEYKSNKTIRDSIPPPCPIVRSIYSMTPKKLQQKVSLLIPLGLGVLYNILKVYQSRAPGKVCFSRWRPRWPPKHIKINNSVTIHSNQSILVSTSRFSGARNTLRPSKMALSDCIPRKSNMASKMATKTYREQ